MLEGLRVASQNWIGRAIMALVMGVIVVSFSIWGVGDVFRGFTAQRLAKVGAGEVTVEQFRSAFQNDLRRIQQRMRRAVTAEEAHRAGMDLQVLERLITEVALDQKASNLGLATSDETAQRLIASEKAFQTDGKFDAEKFKAVARDAGYTERSFLADQKAAYLRKALTDIVVTGVETPKLMIEAIHRFRNEARSVDYFVLPVSAAGEAAKPTDDELKKYFNDREQTFRAKEFRKIVVLEVSPSTVAKVDAVSDDDARKLYEDVKAKRYGTPDRFLGLISDRDLLGAFASDASDGVWEQFKTLVSITERGRRHRALKGQLRAKTASAVMRTDVVTVREDAPIDEVIGLMTARGFKRLPVVDGAGHFTGMISRDSLLRTGFARQSSS